MVEDLAGRWFVGVPADDGLDFGDLTGVESGIGGKIEDEWWGGVDGGFKAKNGADGFVVGFVLGFDY